MSPRLEVGIGFLAAAGLNLFAVLDCAALPKTVWGNVTGWQAYGRLVLIGHGGRRLWQQELGAA